MQQEARIWTERGERMAFLPFGFQPLRKNVKIVVPIKFRQIGKTHTFFQAELIKD